MNSMQKKDRWSQASFVVRNESTAFFSIPFGRRDRWAPQIRYVLHSVVTRLNNGEVAA
jgi:hypothetical protein